MNKNPESPTIKRISWFLWGSLALLSILLVSAFSHAWSLHQTLEEKEALLEPLLTAQQEEHATLQAQLTYVQSDAYVEEWAQNDARMTRPGETLVILIIPTPTPTLTPTPLPAPTPTPTPLPFWQRWWQSLTGR